MARGEIEAGEMPSVAPVNKFHVARFDPREIVRTKSFALSAICAVVFIYAFFAFPSYRMYQADLTVLAAIGALGLNLITGYAGQASIGAAAFLAIGAFSASGVQGHVGFVVAVIVGAFAAAVAGLLVGLPALRMRGLYLIISTLVFQYLVQDGFEIVETKQGALAGYALPKAQIAGWTISSTRSWFILLTIVLVLCCIVMRFLVTSKPGRAWTMIKEHDVAAAIAGIQVGRYKITAFVISSAMLGMAGALGAYFVGQVSYDQYTLNLAVLYVAMIIVGGTGSIIGSIIGAVIITDIPFILSQLGSNSNGVNFFSQNLAFIELAVNALLLIGFLIAEPRGLAHIGTRIARSFAVRRAKRLGVVVAPETQPSESAEAPSVAEVHDVKDSDAGVEAQSGSSVDEVMPVLNVENLSVRYFGTKLAVDGVSLDVHKSEIVGLVGPNGAGRTSLLAGIAGLVPCTTSELTLNGKSLEKMSALQRSRSGVILVPERDKVFPHLTVAEHLDLAAASRSKSRQQRRTLISDALGYFPGLEKRRSSRAGTLSGGERQMLALAAALCLQPEVMLIDELSLGLAHGVVVRLTETLRQIADAGVGVLLVEQSLGVAESIVDRLHFMESGRFSWSGTPDELNESRVAAGTDYESNPQ
jgi:branched-chain amino acid transport system permease protein